MIDESQHGIPYEELTATYRDAVRCARTLGVHYLNIDSMCIIQSVARDFKPEVQQMEEDTRGTYCVIAATRATGQ